MLRNPGWRNIVTELVPTIGLEVHTIEHENQDVLWMFDHEWPGRQSSDLSGVFGASGALPVVNDQAVRLAVRAGLALGCSIDEFSICA